MADVDERAFLLESLDGSLTALRDEQVPNAADARLAPQSVLSAEEHELLLLMLQEAPIEADGSSDGIDGGDDDDECDGDDSDKTHAQDEDVMRSDVESSERNDGRAQNTTTSAEKVTKRDATTTNVTRKGAVFQTQLQQQQQGKHEQQQEKVVKTNPRRNRKRRKHEVDALRIEAKELTAKLQQLQLQQQVAVSDAGAHESGNLVAKCVPLDVGEGDESQQQSSQVIVIKKEKASPSLATSSIWESLAWFQREEVRTAMKENLRLKSLYRQQLQMLQQLETLHNIPQSALHGVRCRFERSHPSIRFSQLLIEVLIYWVSILS